MKALIIVWLLILLIVVSYYMEWLDGGRFIVMIIPIGGAGILGLISKKRGYI